MDTTQPPAAAGSTLFRLRHEYYAPHGETSSGNIDAGRAKLLVAAS